MGTLQIPFHIVFFYALFNHGYHPIQELQIYVFINMVITRVKNGSPDIILTAFDGKFHGQKDELPPKAFRPPKTLLKTTLRKWPPKKLKKNNADKEGPPSARPPERGVRGAAAPRLFYMFGVSAGVIIL